jgi:hypothetical protein
MAAATVAGSISDVISRRCHFSSLCCHFPVAISGALSDIAPVAAGRQRLTVPTYPRNVIDERV